MRANLPIDSTLTVEAPNLPRAEGLFYRNIVGIIFDDSTSGKSIRRLLARYTGTIIGGSRGDKEYIVRVPDPGPTFAEVESVIAHLSGESGVTLARKIYYRTPIAIEGHSSRSFAAIQGDTTRPALPSLPILPSDSTFTVESPGYPRSQLLYYRNIVGIVFDDSTSGATIRGLFARYEAKLIGGAAGAVDSMYIIRVPDPGATIDSLETLLTKLEREPGVKRVDSIYYRTPVSLYTGNPASPRP